MAAEAIRARILVTGATGYIGGRLVPRLLAAGHSVRCMAREPERLKDRFGEAEVVAGDVFDPRSVAEALDGVDVAYYLIHSMSPSTKDFAQNDRVAAHIFGNAARAAGVKRIVYLGGLGSDEDELSHHLRSRHEVGDILRSYLPVVEFRAAMIVGSGSASFEMMRYLTERLPVMIAPKWIVTRCQPIAVADVLAYLVAELSHSKNESVVYEIGGADKLSYKQMMERYAAIRGLFSRALVVPFFTPRLSSAWVHLVTPIPSSVARPLIDGLFNEVVVRDNAALREFDIVPMGFDAAVRRALDRMSVTGPETTWFDAYGVRSLPGEFAGVKEGMLIDRRLRESHATPHALFTVFASLGGTRGWLYADWLWDIRGAMDRVVGGVGMRRGRRSAESLRVGDAIDFWRVEAYEPDHLLRLRAEMRLPGEAWLQFEALPAGSGAMLRQTAFFDPHGLFGYLYWYACAPFHAFIFRIMATRIAANAVTGNLSTKHSGRSLRWPART